MSGQTETTAVDLHEIGVMGCRMACVLQALASERPDLALRAVARATSLYMINSAQAIGLNPATLLIGTSHELLNMAALYPVRKPE